MATFSERLKQLQIERNVLKKDIAAAAGVSITGYYYYETGKCNPTVNVLVKLSKILNCSVDYLLGLSNTPFIQDPAFDAEPSELERVI